MNVGILGAGYIAGLLANTLNLMEGSDAYAVAARDLGKAQAFAKEYKIPHAYGSYEEMLRDPAVDLVYIATLNFSHFEHIKLCLDHGKAILCEKPFTLNAAQAETILNLGEQKKILITEAIWTRYMPMRKVMNEVLASGIIGKSSSLMANLAYAGSHNPRLYDPALGGGALVDMGVYAINFALMTFGDAIKDIHSVMIPYKTGVDAQNSTTFSYTDGRIAILHSSFLSRSDRRGTVFGDKGYIEFLNINNCQGIRVYDTNDKLIASHETPKQLTGYEYQLESCKKALREGRTECPEMPHSETIKVMGIMDSIRKIWGFRYPGE
ncbi:oxidoreductase [Spirochaetia bacterium]|nr:oxidoreductase [Spirochaetia bacterium]